MSFQIEPDEARSLLVAHPEFAGFVEPKRSKYWLHYPHPKQEAFLACNVREMFFGGAGGPGKSEALLMAALQYVDVPGYAALILRRTYADLALPGALMDRAREWLTPTDARWSDKDKTWHFPAGGSLTFGYLETEKDKYRYQSAEFQSVAFDELTAFTSTQYLYLFTRLRRLEGSTVPIRMRSASNPGGLGHEWVKERFVDPDTARAPFLPARIADNPSLDRADYIESLSHVDPTTRAQIELGDWEATDLGGRFRREWFQYLDEWPGEVSVPIRSWDFAATKPNPKNPDPDWTAGGLVGDMAGAWVIGDIRRRRDTPKQIEDFVRATAFEDRATYGHGVEIFIEIEPGSSGEALVSHYRRNILSGFTVHAKHSTGAKETYWQPVASAAEAGNVYLIKGPWVKDFLDEAEGAGLPGVHDDQLDAVSKAVWWIALGQGSAGHASGRGGFSGRRRRFG